MLNAIFGIFGIFGKKNSNGKKKGYFLELDESKTETAVAAVKTVVEDIKTSAAEAVETAVEKVETVVEDVMPKKAESKSKKKTSVKAKKAQPKKEAEPEVVQSVVVAKPTVQVPTEVNFATKYLIAGPVKSRRRPGANMKTFLSMANQVKKPMFKK